jgi:hypothetical protein
VAQGTAAAAKPPLEASGGAQYPAKSTTIAAPASAQAPALAPANPNFLRDLKVVTFLEPTAPASLDDRDSVCHSPSWEAYGRRKKEKKESKEKRKLTKVPPTPTSAPASAPAAVANSRPPIPVSSVSTSPSKATSSKTPSVQAPASSSMPDSRTRHAQAQLPQQSHTTTTDRSASAMASHNAAAAGNFPLDMPPPPTLHTPRSRSGSFSSIFKAPFEFRRSSIDHDRERQTGFLGGIKLEQHRNESQQRALDQSILGPDGEIHPAFRRERRSSSPLRFFTSRQSSSTREPEDRHYPPIAINTSKNQALLASEPSGDTPDGGMMKKWRQRVGLKGSSKGSESDTEGPSERKTRGRRLSKSAQRDQAAPTSGTTAAVASHGKSASTSALDRPPVTTRPSLAPSPLKSWQGILPGSKAPEKSAEYVDNHEHADYTLPPISPLSPYSLTHDAENFNIINFNNNSKDRDLAAEEPSPLSSDDGLAQLTLAAADDVAPPPPRKSSKRKSLISLNDADLGHGATLLNPLGINPPTPFTAASADGRRSSTSLSDARAAQQQQPSADRKGVPGKLIKAHRQTVSNPPSIAYESVSHNADGSAASKRTLRDAARAAFGRPTSSASQYAGAVAAMPNVTSPSRPTSRSRPSYYSGSVPATETRHLEALAAASKASRDSIHLGKPARILGEADWRTGFTPTTTSPPTNSSDDSGTDDGHDGHARDTPDTSRPQSERGGSFDHDDMKHPRPIRANSALPSPTFSTSSEPRMSTDRAGSTVELDNVQTAAMKVLAAFPDAAPRRPNSSSDWRCSSDSNLTVSFLPKGNRASFQSTRDRSKPRPIKTNVPPARDVDSKSPPLRDLLMAKDESAATAPWPATYLEAARKAAPAAPAPKTLQPQTSTSSMPNLTPPKRITPNRSRQSSPGPSNLSHQRNQSSTGTSASSASTTAHSAVVDGEPIAKMFVECCACKFYHDMPSKLYEAMAHPEDVVPTTDNVAFAGALSMTVRCPWCKHDMSTKCCAGLAAMVYVKERLH